MKEKKIANKMITKTTSLFVALSIMMSIFSINIFASEPEPPYLNTYAAYYFHNLNENFGNNIESTCGYVAAGMLLSFYDSYWNDNFIQEDYDVYGEIEASTYEIVSSPGINRENDWREESGYTDYNDYIDDNYEDFFHLKLLQIGRDELKLCDFTLKEWLNYIFRNIPLETDWLININDVSDVIEKYLSGLTAIVGENKTISDCVTVSTMCSWDLNDAYDDSNLAVRNEMISKIKNGIPVLYFGYSEEDDSGHFMIAYDYDEDNDEIYFHTGWRGDTSMTNKEPEAFIFDLNTAILWLEITDTTFLHSHAMNYSTSTMENAFCSCQLFSTHPAHESNHISISGNSGCDGTNHWTNGCHCGKPSPDSVVTPHDLSYVYTPGSDTHYQECEGCGYSDFVYHNYNQLTSVSDTHHANACKCGAVSSTQEAHTPSRYVSNSTSSPSIYCRCGHLISQDLHEMIIISPRLSKCIHCGYVRDTSIPGQIIMGIEEEYDTCKE